MAATEPVQSFVAVVCSNDSDAPAMQHAITVLDELQIQSERVVLRPGGIDLATYIDEGRGRGLEVVIVGTSQAYTDELIPTVLEAYVLTLRVVTGPMPASLDRVALNIPLLGSGPDGAVNAALFAARVLARTDPALRERLRARPRPPFPPPEHS